MKKLLIGFTLPAFIFVVVSTNSFAIENSGIENIGHKAVRITDKNIQKGQTIFKKKFRRLCGFSGVRFGREHSREEWQDLYTAGQFQNEAIKICPSLGDDNKNKKIKDSYWFFIYLFAREYSKGVSLVPEC